MKYYTRLNEIHVRA